MPATVGLDYLLGYLDKNGKIVIEPRYESAENYLDGYAVVCSQTETGNAYGVIDRLGHIAISSEWDSIQNLGQGIFILEQNDSYGIRNLRTGAWSGLAYCHISAACDFQQGHIIARDLNGDHCRIDFDGAILERNVMPSDHDRLLDGDIGTPWL